MTRVSAPDPVADLVAELARRGVDADDSSLTRALYSSDASLYRVLPAAVARPRHRDDLEAVLEVAALAGSSVTMRGAGTSIAGNAVGEGIVVDTRRLDRVLEIDTVARTARVEPGVVHAALQRAAAPYGLRYGPDPSTHTRCTIGGMVGNNACGSRALGYGRTADTIVEADVLWGDRDAAPGEVEARLAAVVGAELGHVRTSFGQFSRQVSGYSLEHLLPELAKDGRGVSRFFAGSEGTLGLLREVVVSLVPEEARDLLVLGYPSMVEAADAVPSILGGVEGDARLVACEGLDARIVDLVRARGGTVPELPQGSGWLFVEVAGTGRAGALSSLVAVAGALDARVVGSAAEAAALWRIREDGAGLAARSLGRPAHSGWEDAAVPPERLGAWLRDFDALLREHRLDGVPYGHFGDGCVHVRIDFDFSGGPQAFREFLVACAERLREHGGSLSGEHGDGRARSELLPLMYDETSLALFAAVKHACDPVGLLNPGVLVDPRPFDADLRPVRPVLLAPDLAQEVHRCTGVGKCVAPAPAGVMCPSYVATRDEKDSTRGRARVLQEAVTGGLPGGLADPAVHEALDLCLSCKGCLSDCPTGVDMAEYKSEVLHQTYAGKRRPRSHYALGALPRWARLGAPMARAGNLALRGGPLASLAKAVAGVDQRRSLPVLAAPRFRKAAGGEPRRRDTEPPDVWVWADSFTEYFRTGPGLAAIDYLEGAGLEVRVIDERGVLRADVDLDRAARHGPHDPGPHPHGAGAVRRQRCAGAGDRALLHGGAPVGRRAGRRDPGRAGGPARPPAAGPRRGECRRAAALPPLLGARVGRRPRSARAGRGDRDGRAGLLRSRRQLGRGEGPLRDLRRRRGVPSAAGGAVGARGRSGRRRPRRRAVVRPPARRSRGVQALHLAELLGR